MKKPTLLIAAALLGLAGSLSASPLAKRAATSGATDEYGRLVTILEEDFSLFTEGSEQSPAENPLLTDWSGNFHDGKTLTPGWGGKNVHEAGGSAYIATDGSLWSPDIDLNDAVDYRFYVSFRAKLAPGAAEGTPSVKMGYGTPAQGEPLGAEWKEYRIPFSGAYSGTYLTFSATTEWLIDDISVEKVKPFIDTPENPRFSEYTIDSFKAQWQAVENAREYLLSVYTYNSTGRIIPYITDLQVEATYHTVSQLPPADDFYYFTVKAVDDMGHISEPSDEVCVEALVVPKGISVDNVTENGFKASWNPVDGARYYDIWIYRQTTATTPGAAYIFNSDFSFVSADDKADGESISYDDMPGWIIYDPLMDNGQLGLDGYAAGFSGQYYASMESPAYNLSYNGGNVDISMNVKAKTNTVITISLYTMRPDGTYPIYPESYIKLTDVTEEYRNRTFSLTGGGEQSVIFIQVNDWGEAWFDDLQISQEVNTGDILTAPLYSTLTEENHFQLNAGINFTENTAYYFIIRAIGGVNQNGTDYVYSDFSAPCYIDPETGAITAAESLPSPAVSAANGEIRICNPAADPVTVYDAAGRLLHSSSATAATIPAAPRTIHIVRIGSHSFKVIP